MIDSSNDNEKLSILYMYNPDKVTYNEMDDNIIHNLELFGMRVQKFELNEINFLLYEGKIRVFIKNEEVHVDGFLAYGYMSKFNYESYLLIISTFERMNIPCLHTVQVETILSNKYLQATYYASAGIPIPKTFQGYSINSYKNIMTREFTDNKVIVKRLDDYGGDGVKRCETPELAANFASKLFYDKKHTLFQEYIKDSFGKSIRVLCIAGKAVGVVEYEDKVGNFLSNCMYGFENYSLNSLMNSPDRFKYIELAEKAINCIGNVTIGGVDILDSKEHGLVVLEINGFPDIYDMAHAINQELFKSFANAYHDKIKKNKFKI